VKKIYFLVVLALSAATFISAQPNCVIDPTNTSFFSPRPDSIPCIERNVAYTQVIQIHVPTSFDVGPFVGLTFPVLITVDSLHIDTLTGLPNGMAYEMKPADGRFKGGDNGCATLYGTTSDQPGSYPIAIEGTIWVSGIPPFGGFPADTSFDLATAQQYSNMFRLAVEVINTGDPCLHMLSVKDFSPSLNAAMNIYPNPSHGVFELKINTGGRIEGEIVVTDITGKKVFTQSIDAMGNFNTTLNLSDAPKGIYSLQLRTADGFASKNISIE
jgi:hypothetical protein